jgi:hypothetical protein
MKDLHLKTETANALLIGLGMPLRLQAGYIEYAALHGLDGLMTGDRATLTINNVGLVSAAGALEVMHNHAPLVNANHPCKTHVCGWCRCLRTVDLARATQK